MPTLGPKWYLAVTPHTDDELIGFVRIGLSGVRAGKLGYAIAADHWGHGYATDATQTMVTFGFEVLGLHRITASIGPDNLGSIAVVNKLGFTREGRLRDHVFTNGAWRDSELYSILVHEWNMHAEHESGEVLTHRQVRLGHVVTKVPAPAS